MNPRRPPTVCQLKMSRVPTTTATTRSTANAMTPTRLLPLRVRTHSAMISNTSNTQPVRGPPGDAIISGFWPGFPGGPIVMMGW